ncbi:MAG: PaaI family thioesterase [Candidatus Hydrogenedentes bacterium]|nr:PaaI family thioesterase [Candidatus Hydrogenedentota bacterium]
MPDNYCYGCGANNPHGLQIKSHWDGNESVCTFMPSPHHSAGPRQYLNGGIIATLIDCHCICTAVANAYRNEGRDVGEPPEIWYVTGGLNVSYLKPTPIDKPVMLRARIVDEKPKKTVLHCTLSSDGADCARGEVVAVRVPSEWKG